MAQKEQVKQQKNDNFKTLSRELFALMLKKAGLTEQSINEEFMKIWINQNLDLLTKSELEKYKMLFL